MQSIVKVFFITGASCILHSCVHEFSCDTVTKDLLKKHASIIIKDIGPSGRIINYSGVDVNTGNKSYFIDEGGMYLPMKDIVEIGDTLLKSKGQTRFLVKKKHLIVRFKFVCFENQGYGFDIDTLKRGTDI